jgi:hypothetical protein
MANFIEFKTAAAMQLYATQHLSKQMDIEMRTEGHIAFLTAFSCVRKQYDLHLQINVTTNFRRLQIVTK